MILSKTLSLLPAVSLAASVLGSAVPLSPRAYSVPGTLDANKYDIDLADQAVAEAALKIDGILSGFRNKTKVSNINNTSLTTTSRSQVATDRLVGKELPVPICRHWSCPNGVERPPSVTFLSISKDSSDARDVPAVSIKTSTLTLESNNSSADNATLSNYVNEAAVAAIRNEICLMAKKMLQASWGVQGNLFDSGDRLKGAEMDEMGNDMSKVLTITRNAVYVTQEAETATKVDMSQPLQVGGPSLTSAIAQLWTPFNEFVVGLQIQNRTDSIPNLEKLVQLASEGSKFVSLLMAQLMHEEL